MLVHQQFSPILTAMQENRLESMCTPVLRDPHAARAAEMVIDTRTGAAAAVTHIRIALVVPVFAPHLIAVGSRWRRRGVRESERDCMCMHRTESWVVEENAHERDSAMQVSRARRTQVNEPKDKQIDHGRAWNAATAAVPHQHTHKKRQPVKPVAIRRRTSVCVCACYARWFMATRSFATKTRAISIIRGTRARGRTHTKNLAATRRCRPVSCSCVCVRVCRKKSESRKLAPRFWVGWAQCCVDGFGRWLTQLKRNADCQTCARCPHLHNTSPCSACLSDGSTCSRRRRRFGCVIAPPRQAPPKTGRRNDAKKNTEKPTNSDLVVRVSLPESRRKNGRRSL